jgi:putative oxidoreductase
MIDETDKVDTSTLIFPGLAGIYRHVAPLGYAFLRIVVALIFLPGGTDRLFHGDVAKFAGGSIANLGFAQPLAWGWAVTILEFFGAILLGLGLFTRPVAVAFAIELTVIGFGIMGPRGGFFWTKGGLEVALLMELAIIGFIFGGGGRYSLDRLIGWEF